jgi:hypothetical protein
MPFVKKERRDKIARLGPVACQDVGDACYVFYKYMVREWKLAPRWRTIHRLYKDLILDDDSDAFLDLSLPLAAKFDVSDIKAAAELAWQCFMILYGWPYELQKIQENGDIE